MHTTSILSFLALSSISGAVPFYLDERQNSPPICQLDPANRSSWQAGGGNIFLQSWFEKMCKDPEQKDCEGPHSQRNWLREMDSATTDDGSGNSNLDCTDINSNSCQAPSIPCKDFTPFNYYYVRQMAAQVHAHMKLAHEQLQNFAIVESLGIDQIVNDFTLPVDSPNKALSLASSSFWLAGSVFSGGPVEGGILNAIGAILGLIGTSITPPEPDYAALKRDMESYLSTIFTETNNRIDRLLKRLFGENDSDTILDEVLEQMKFSGFNPDPRYIHDPISRFLSSGAFLESTANSPIRTSLIDGFKQMKKGLIGNLLAGLNVHVLHNSNTPESSCNGKGMKYVGGACAELYILPPGSTKAEKIIPEWYDKLEQNYQFDLSAFYENIINCNNGDASKSITAGNAFPPCMFGIKVIKTSSKGCWPACFPDNGDTLPDTFKDSNHQGQGLFETCHVKSCPNERQPGNCQWTSVHTVNQDSCDL